MLLLLLFVLSEQAKTFHILSEPSLFVPRMFSSSTKHNKQRSNLADKLLNAHAELLVAQQQHLDNEEADLSIIAFNIAQ